MKNILVSGCSYTQHGGRYDFPYWHEYFTDNVINVGAYGGNNAQIIMNAQKELLNTKIDEVFIQLSGWDRIDLYGYPLHIGYILNNGRKDFLLGKEEKNFIDIREYIDPYLTEHLIKHYITIEKMQNYTLYHLFQLITYCRANKIKLNVIQGINPMGINSLVKPSYFYSIKNKEIFEHSTIIKKIITNTFFKKIDEMYNEEYIKLIGWPFIPALNGIFLDIYLDGLKGSYRVSDTDGHPNGLAHKVLFDIFQRGSYD